MLLARLDNEKRSERTNLNLAGWNTNDVAMQPTPSPTHGQKPMDEASGAYRVGHEISPIETWNATQPIIVNRRERFGGLLHEYERAA
jgi:hypothetical protein